MLEVSSLLFAKESWLLLFCAVHRGAGGLSPDRVESKLAAGEFEPFSGGRTVGGFWKRGCSGVLNAEGTGGTGAVGGALGWLGEGSRGGGRGAAAGGGRLPAPRTWSSSRWSKPLSSGILPPVYLP